MTYDLASFIVSTVFLVTGVGLFVLSFVKKSTIMRRRGLLIFGITVFVLHVYAFVKYFF